MKQAQSSIQKMRSTILEQYRNGRKPWNKGLIGLSIGWEKGKKRTKQNIENNRLAIKEGFKNGRKVWNKGRNDLPKAELSNRWEGDNLSYIGLHTWLREKFGRATMCENTQCKCKSKRFNWALKKGYEYERKRESFIQLCSQCHILYDDILKKGWKTRKNQQ